MSKISEKVIICTECQGIGYVNNPQYVYDVTVSHRMPCPICEGKGRLLEEVFHSPIN